MMLLYAAGDLGHDPCSLEEHLTGIQIRRMLLRSEV